jgi:hypothetical protein
MTRIAIVLMLVAGLFAQTPPPAEDGTSKEKPPRWLAIVGATVWPVSSPPILDGTVLVKDDKIVAVGRRTSVTVPKGAQVIDATGRHVAPGFVAASSRGVLGVRGNTLKEKAKDRVDPFSDTMLMALAAGITTAHEGPSGRGGFAAMMGGGGGGAFGGTPKGMLGGVIGKLCFGTIDGFEVKDPAGVYMGYNNRSATQLRETHEALEKAAKYHKERRAWLEELAAGKKDAKEPKTDEGTAALARCIDGDLPLFIEADDRRAIEGSLELCDRYGVPLVIHGALEAWTVAPDIGRRPVTALVTHRGRGGSRTKPYRDKYVSQPHGWTISNAATLSAAGVPWGTVTLGGGIMTGLFAGRDLMGLPHEACFAVRGGATDAEALRSITLTAAEILNIDDRVGSLVAGKDADILLMDLEPLDYRSFVDLAWVNGRLVYDRSEVPLWNHIRTDRSQGMGPWTPFGPWPEFQELPAKPLTESGGD